MKRVPSAVLLLIVAGMLSGCSLLFVQKGSFSVSSKDAKEVRSAPSLASRIEAGSQLTHKVAPGDNLSKISRKYYGTSRHARAIAKKNGLDPKAPLKVGRVLKLDPPEAPGAAAATARFVEKQVGGKTYVIEVSGVGTKDRPKGNPAFAVGEYLRFVVKFFAVTGGYATLEVRDLVEREGRPCYKLVGTAEAAFPFSSVYTVDEYLESLFDAIDFFPWRFEKKVVEGHYHERCITEFEQLKHQALRLKNRDAPQTLTIPPFVQDILSSFFYARLLDIAPGDKFAIPTQAGDKNYELVVEVLRRESQRVKAGKFDCLVVKPHVKYDNVFQNKGDVLLWITDDARHLPVLIRSKILVGNIDVELIEARLPKIKE